MSAPKQYTKGMNVAVGEKVVFSNGAHAVKRADGRFKFVKGGNVNMANLRARRSGSRKRNTNSAKGNRNIMGRYYNKKSYKSPSRRAAAIKRDMCHKGKSVVNDSRWAQNPRRHDLEGFDDGSQCDSPTEYKYRAPSAKQAAALARGRAKRASMRGGADGCSWSGKACSKNGTSNEEWCQMGKKNRCVKSPAGRKSAPRRTASAAQLAGLAKGRNTRAANLAAKKASAARRTPSPMAMMGCHDLPMDDCVAHPHCNYIAEKANKKGKMVKAHCKRSTKGEKRGKRSPKRN